MSTVPETVRIPKQESRLVEFTSWTWTSAAKLNVTSVVASYAGMSVPLVWKVWNFEEITEGEGSGVRGKLSFSYPNGVPPVCNYWYDSVLWPAGATLTLRCEYDNNPDEAELLPIKLV